MKKIMFSILLCILFLCCCSRKPATYQFANPIEEITNVAILNNQNESGEGTDASNIYLIRELEEDEIVAFMNDIYQLQTNRRSGGPLWGYGSYIAKVTYANGDVEMLGTLNIEFIPNGTLPTGFGSYYFTDDSLWMVISEYIPNSDTENPLSE